MSLLRNPATFAGLWLAAGCNALFGVEAPNLITEANGGEAGQRGGGPAILPALPDAGGSGDSGAGGTNDAGIAGDAGAGGALPSPQAPTAGGESGAGGFTEPPLGTGGALVVTGGSPPVVGTGGEAPIGFGGSAGAAGTGGNACSSGTRYCDDDTLVSCESGSLQKELCAFGCESNACRPECTQPSVECNNNRQRVCGSDGRFGPEQECTGQTCVPGMGCRECAPSDVRCNAENGDAERCVDGEWASADVCERTVKRCVVEAGVAKCIDNIVFPLPEPALSGGTLFSRTPDTLYVYPMRQGVGSESLLALQLGAVGSGQPAYAVLALYQDNGEDYPGQLLGTTATITFSQAGDVIRDLEQGVVVLRPDQKYWIGIVFAAGGTPQLQCRRDDEAPGGFLVHQPFVDAMPTTFPTSGALGDAEMECNLFLRVRYQTPE